MKYLLIIFAVVLFSKTLAAQTDTTIVYLDDHRRPCPENKSTRYALQFKENDRWKKIEFDKVNGKRLAVSYFSDPACTLLDGPYTTYSQFQQPLTTGQYQNNKKTGSWKSFSEEGRLIDSTYYKDGFMFGLSRSWYEDGSLKDSFYFENGGNGSGRGYWPDRTAKDSGTYSSDKKEGRWTYYHKNGMRCQEVVYQADSAISFTCYDQNGQVQTENCYYEKEASFKTGDRGWINYLIARLGNAKLPDNYLKGAVYGTVYIQFVVNTDGSIIKEKIIGSVDPALDAIALKVVRESPKWDPAVQFNRNVVAYRKQPITFPKAQ